MEKRPMTQSALTRRRLLSLESFAGAVGMHPEHVRRLIALGLLDASLDASGEQWLAPDQVAAAARLQRIRAGLAVNYAALGVIVDLLDRIAVLEAALRNRPQRDGGPTWTRTA